MSVSSFTTCVTCNQRPMEIGDGGMIGTPDPKPSADVNEDWGVTTYTFGWIHDGLQAVSLVTHELQAYKRFLDEHAGHELHLGNDHMDADELPDVDHEATTRFELPTDGFVQGTWEIAASESGDVFRTSWDGERFLPFEARDLAADDVARFLERLTAPELFDSITMPNPTLDPYADLGSLVEFVQGHASETLRVRLLPKG